MANTGVISGKERLKRVKKQKAAKKKTKKPMSKSKKKSGY